MQMFERIQGFKLQCNINSMDFNRYCTHFATGGKDYIRIYSLNLNDQCWFKIQKTYGKYKGTSQTKANVTQLSWNKYGKEVLAIGTSSGLAFVYDAEAPYRMINQYRGHEGKGQVKNIEWNPQSPDRFVTACFDNQIIEWDMRSEKGDARELNQSTKIRDLKFNPHRPWLLAVQSSTKLEMLDLRKGKEVVSTFEINSNQLHGIGVKWDPVNPYRIASAISKEITIFDISSNSFQKVDWLRHYSLIKSFHWMKTKPSFFGIMCDKPQKNIVFYDIEDKNRMAYYYAGHQRPMQCWIMDNNQTILITASNHKERVKAGSGIANNPNYAFLVAQYTQNYFDPNQPKFNHPLAFNNDSEIAFCLNLDNSSSKNSSSFDLRKKRVVQTAPAIYHFRDRVEWFQREKGHLFPISLREQIVYLARNYLLDGHIQKIAQNNSQVALRIGKSYCAQLWKNIFQICYPQGEVPTIQSIYQRKMQVNISVVDNRVILHNQQGNLKATRKINVMSLLQWLVDQHNQLQTVALASICLLTQAPECITQQFVDKLWFPYIDLLNSLQLYDIAAESILITKIKRYTQLTQTQTKYNVTCGSCRLSVSKGQCKCNLLCVLCEQRLNKRLVIWCKYCGHGGHAVEYQTWFKNNKFCPHGCGHACFSAQDYP